MSAEKSRWFPKKGDLVSVPSDKSPAPIPGLSGKCSYGIVISEDKSSDFPGVWWKILHSGLIEVLHIHTISPMWDKDGAWLRTAR